MLGLALGIGGLIAKGISRLGANDKLKALDRLNPQYKENPLAAQRLGLANTLLNARSPGAASLERNIFSNQANTINNIQRGATDSSQLLSAAGGVQGQTNNAFDNLNQFETQDYQRRYGNVVGAQDGVIREQDKVFNDQVRRFNDKVGFTGAQVANNANTFGDMTNLGFALEDFGMNGGFKGMFGNSNKPAPQPTGVSMNPNWRAPRYNPATGRVE